MKNICTLAFLLLAIGRFSAQCIVMPSCPATQQACDYTPNNVGLWNDALWYDAIHQSQNLADVPVEAALTVSDTCAGANLSVRYLLYLDLDNNGTWETVVKSWEPPAAGTVNFGNAGNPNFEGGESRYFDQRPVVAADKYQFAIQISTNGNAQTAQLRWNTPNQPNTFVDTELPYATHKIKWLLEDDLGNDEVCEYPIVAKDCKSPTVVCLNGLSVNIMPTGLITLWAADFLQYGEDNATQTPHLKFGIRKSGVGTGFPENPDGSPLTSVEYDCDELGTQTVELWARDAVGNADFCETYVIVQDQMGNCGQMNTDFAVCTEHWCTGQSLYLGSVNILGSVNFAPPLFQFNMGDSLDGNGCAKPTQSIGVPVSSTFQIAPEYDDFPTNGVTVLDLIKIRRFLLDLDPHFSPYAQIAADANKSGSVTSFDLVELRKLILNIYTELPNNTSWRFVDASFDFPNPQNPFQTAFPETVSIADAQQTAYQASFKAIKIGDLDCDAWMGAQGPSHGRDFAHRSVSMPDLSLVAGETAEISLQMPESGSWAGLQLGLQFDSEKVEVLQVLPGHLPGMDAEAFHRPGPGLLNMVWADEPTHVAAGQAIFSLRVRAHVPLRVSEVFQLSEKQENLGSLHELPQTLALEFRESPFPSSVGETIVLAPQPNPTSAGAQIPVQISRPENVRVEISDAAGKVLYVNVLELGAGKHLLDVPPHAMPQSGLYFWRVVAGEQSASGKLLRQ